MKSRWQEWVIVVTLILVGAVGVGAIWGDDLARFWTDLNKTDEPVAPEGLPASDEPQPVAPPAGPPI